jgi:ATP-dependent Lon protease
MAEERDEIRPRSELDSGGMQVAVGSGGEEESTRFDIPDVLPILPLKNTVLFPFLLSPLLVSSPRSKALIDQALLSPQRVLVAVAVRHPVDGSPGADDVYRVGTVVRVAKMLTFPDESYRLLVQGLARVRIDKFVSSDPFLRAGVQVLEETGDPDSVETTALVRNLSQQFSALVAASPRLSDELQVLAANLDEPSKLSDLVGSSLDLDVAAKQAILEEVDVPTRLKRVLEEMARERDAMKVESEIRDKVQSDLGKTQRDYMLRQQLEAIRQELGEAEDAESEVSRLRQHIEAAGMPEEAHEQAVRELDRLAAMPTAAAEYGVIRTYLEWVADLPWSKLSKDRLDVDEARRILDEDHYGLEKVKDRIVEYIAVLSLKRDLKGPILCFVGAPGTGKTSLGRSIARALGREFQRISLGGVRDEAEIRGHRRTYVGALPGRIVQGMRRAGTRNPSSSWTRSTRWAPTSGAIRRRRCSRCSIRSRTRPSATTTSRCPSTFRRCCSSPRRTSWTRSRLPCAIAWR